MIVLARILDYESRESTVPIEKKDEFKENTGVERRHNQLIMANLAWPSKNFSSLMT